MARREQFATELDAMKRFVLEEAKLSDSQMIDAWLSIVDRAAKLFRLDAPRRASAPTSMPTPSTHRSSSNTAPLSRT